MSQVELLRLSSLWPGVIANINEIEEERKKVEALQGCEIEVFEVTYPTLSGVYSTKVRWKVVSSDGSGAKQASLFLCVGGGRMRST